MTDGNFPLISDTLVRVGASPGDKSSAIREVGTLLLHAGYVEAPYLASMEGRERAADTFLGSGVAIPHGKVEDKGYVLHDGIAVLQIPQGVEWNPGQTARLVVGIAARSDGHLDILKRLTRLMQEEGTIERLSSTDDASIIVSALMQEKTGGTGETAAEDLEVRAEWVVDYPSGLHARPASLWVKAAKSLEGPLRLRRGSETADPRNMLALLRLGIKAGETIVISAGGPKAEESVRRLKETMAALSAQEKRDFERAAQKAEPAAPKDAWLPPSGSPALKGVSASPGMAVGTILKIGARAIEVEDEPASLEESSRLLDTAIEEAKRQLEDVIEETLRRLGQNEAAIFKAHLGILEDPRLLTLASRTVVAGHGAAWAWHHAVETLANELAAIDNQLLAARASDMRDVGRRVLRALRKEKGDEHAEGMTGPDGSPIIVLAEDLSPSDTAGLDRERVAALVTALGGPTSHTAIIARTLGLPAIVALGRDILNRQASTAIVDGDSGRVWLDPTEEDLQAARDRMHALREKEDAERAARLEPGRTTDGHTVTIAANVNRPDQVAEALDMGCEGIGLMRTEFLFLDRDTAPDEEEQYGTYRAMLDALGDKPIIVRALDIGGDKRIPHLNLPHEENPFLGVRGIRLLLRHPELLQPQLRALYRAAKKGGNLSVMFPMVGTLDEIRRFRTVCEEVRGSLDAPSIPLGIMIEVPAAALLAEEYAPEVDFFSIGTNDLTQYTLAVDRQNPELAVSADALHPAVLRLVKRTVDGADKHGRWVGICGGIAGDPFGASLLVGLGVTELSMTPRDIPAVKARLRANSLDKLRELAGQALAQSTAEAVRALEREVLS